MVTIPTALLRFLNHMVTIHTSLFLFLSHMVTIPTALLLFPSHNKPTLLSAAAPHWGHKLPVGVCPTRASKFWQWAAFGFVPLLHTESLPLLCSPSVPTASKHCPSLKRPNPTPSNTWARIAQSV